MSMLIFPNFSIESSEVYAKKSLVKHLCFIWKNKKINVLDKRKWTPCIRYGSLRMVPILAKDEQGKLAFFSESQFRWVAG